MNRRKFFKGLLGTLAAIAGMACPTWTKMKKAKPIHRHTEYLCDVPEGCDGLRYYNCDGKYFIYTSNSSDTYYYNHKERRFVSFSEIYTRLGEQV